jgi:hypothetical protein
MKLLRFAAAAAVCASLSSAQDLNRLQLDNGLDVLWFVNAPFTGAPVSNFDPTGDLYWKAFSDDVLQRCSGTSTLQGIEAVVFDTDFFSSEVLWAYTITTGTDGTDQTILPTQSGAGVFVPGTSTTGTIFGSAGCAAPGYVSGWIYSETFLNTASGLPTPLLSLTSDGETDWVFTHYFPAPGIADENITSGPINSCGSTGDGTLQWGGSTDGFGAGTGGENQPDWTGLGNSIYSGFNIGGAGTFSPISEGNDDGPQLAWYFEEPTGSTRVDTDNGDGFPGPELGLAVLETPLQISSGGVPSGGTTTLGARIYRQGSDTTGLSISLWGVNVIDIDGDGEADTFLDITGVCLDLAGAPLGLNPADAGFSIALTALGLNGYTADTGPNPGSAFSDSNQVPAGTGPAWQNLQIAWQGFDISLILGAATSSTQIFRQILRYNDGV